MVKVNVENIKRVSFSEFFPLSPLSHSRYPQLSMPVRALVQRANNKTFFGTTRFPLVICEDKLLDLYLQ